MRATFLSMRALLLSLVMVYGACGSAVGKKQTAATPPAASGVRALIDALRSDDPAPAYALLSAAARKEITLDEFSKVWKRSSAERKAQAQELAEGLRDDPNLGERSRVVFADGKSVNLLREGGEWKLDSALVSRATATRPEDAVRIFAAALAGRNFEATLRILTRSRRNGISKQVDRFITSLIRNQGRGLEMLGKDRAELHWEDEEYRYKIVLKREGDEWRIDDVHLKAQPPKPKTRRW